MSQSYRYARPFQLALPQEKIEQVLKTNGVCFRRRVFCPATTILAWVSQIASQNRSCRSAVSRVVAYHAAQGHRVSASTGAYVQARQRLPLAVVQELVRGLARELEDQCSQHQSLDRPVLIVDGTAISSPDTESLQDAFPQHGKMMPGIGFPIIRALFVTSATTGSVVDLAYAAWQGPKTSESALFRETWSSLRPGDIIVGDRLYASYWNMHSLRRQGVDSLFRKNARLILSGLRVQRVFGRHDRIVFLNRPAVTPKWITQCVSKRIPNSMAVRSTKITVNGPGRIGTIDLTSTLTDPGVKKAEIGQLYRSRWNVELDLKSLKCDLGADILRCQTAEMVRKEIWMTALTMNAVRAIMARAAARIGCPPRHLSFKGALQAMEAFSGSQDERDMTRMLDAIGSHRVANRPDRVEPRAVKRRRKPIKLLMVPRDEARKMLRRREV